MIRHGHEYKIRTVDMLNLSLDLPVMIYEVDTGVRIMAIVPEVEAMVEHGLVTVQKVWFGQKRKRQRVTVTFFLERRDGHFPGKGTG